MLWGMLFLFCLCPGHAVFGAEDDSADESSLEELLTLLLREDSQFRDLKFRSVVRAATDREVLPLEAGEKPDDRIREVLQKDMAGVMDQLNRPESPTNQEGRINEVSAHFERKLREKIDSREEFTCEVPQNEEGDSQVSGYPDLRMVHTPTGRVAYLDPKLVAEGALDNGFRTFYYSPKGQTNKILDDAHHLLIGIVHDRNTGNWEFLDWHLVDLYDFTVDLKAEFQAGNDDLYRPELLVGDEEGEDKGSGEEQDSTGQQQ